MQTILQIPCGLSVFHVFVIPMNIPIVDVNPLRNM